MIQMAGPKQIQGNWLLRTVGCFHKHATTATSLRSKIRLMSLITIGCVILMLLILFNFNVRIGAVPPVLIRAEFQHHSNNSQTTKKPANLNMNTYNNSQNISKDYNYQNKNTMTKNNGCLNANFVDNMHISNKKIKNTNLTFIHIPKTGGTSIEDIGNKYNYSWGRYNEKFNNILTGNVYRGVPIVHCSPWHIPPYLTYNFNFTSIVGQSINDDDDDNDSLYANKETFCIVRNPYTRVISEWNYLKQCQGMVCCVYMFYTCFLFDVILFASSCTKWV